MNTIKTLAAFLVLAALGRAESTELSDRVIELPPVVVQATRLPAPVISVRETLDEVRAEASQSLRIELRHTLGRSFRRLAADQHRMPPAVDVPAARPNA